MCRIVVNEYVCYHMNEHTQLCNPTKAHCRYAREHWDYMWVKLTTLINLHASDMYSPKYYTSCRQSKISPPITEHFRIPPMPKLPKHIGQCHPDKLELEQLQEKQSIRSNPRHLNTIWTVRGSADCWTSSTHRPCKLNREDTGSLTSGRGAEILDVPKRGSRE